MKPQNKLYYKYIHYVLEHKLSASVQNSVIQKVDNYAWSCTGYIRVQSLNMCGSYFLKIYERMVSYNFHYLFPVGIARVFSRA